MRLAFLFFMFVCSTFSLHAQGLPPKGLLIEKAWVRPATLYGTTAAYMTLTNTGDKPIVVTGGASQVCEKVELHETRDENGVMRMRPQESWTIASGKSLELKPGGRHVMLINLTQDVNMGVDDVILTMTLQGGDTFDIPLSVQKTWKKQCEECCGH